LFILAFHPYAEPQSTYYAKDFPGNSVSQKVAAAQAQCDPKATAPCYIVIDPTLATIAEGAMPVPCVHCIFQDYRTGDGEVRTRNMNGVVDVIADVTGVTDSQPAFQAAISAAHKTGTCVTVPPGKYRLAAPVTLSGGECISGQNGAYLGGATVLLPATAAFVTAAPLKQLSNVTIRDFTIRGGTNAIDLGLFHLVNLYDILCQDQSGWCISHVRGERHEIRNITCWHHTIAGQGCISLADRDNSIFASVYAAAALQDQWWDRSTIDHVFDIGDSYALSDDYTLWSNGGAPGVGNGSISNTNARWVMAHRAGRKGVFHAFNVQLSEFHNFATDGIGNKESPVPIVFDVEGRFVYSALDGFYPRFSGNSHWTTGAYFKRSFRGSTVKNCSVGGDNKSTYGLRFGQDYGNYGEIIACDGSYYNESVNALWRNNISITGSLLAPVNSSAAVNLFDDTGSGAAITLMADDQGAAAATSSFKVIHAKGHGNSTQTFSVGPAGASFDSNKASFPNANGVLAFSGDVGLSRGGAGQLAVGNGTAGDSSGSIIAGRLALKDGANLATLQTNPLSAPRSVVMPDGNSYTVLHALLTTTAADSDVVIVQGMTAQGGCSLTPTNAAAAANIATTYISAKSIGQITVKHAAASGMIYDVMCTP
jgi:hypothetical protein